MSKLKKGTKALKDKLEKAKDKLKKNKNVTKSVISPVTHLRNKRAAEMFRKANSKNKTLEKIKDGIRKSNDAGAISVAKTAAVPGALLYATTETPMVGRGGETSLEPIQTNPIKALKTFIKMELEGKKIGDVSTREIFKYVEENPSYARRIYNRLVKGGEFNADELIKKINKKRKETGLKPYDFDKKDVEKKRDGGSVDKKKPATKDDVKTARKMYDFMEGLTDSMVRKLIDAGDVMVDMGIMKDSGPKKNYKGVEKKRNGGMVRKKKPVKKKVMRKSSKGTKWESKWG